MTKKGIDDKKRPNIDTSSASGIAHLLLLFLWVLLKKSLRALLKFIILFFFYIYKGIKWLVSWWKDGDTKAKREILWTKIKRLSRFIFKWICKGIAAIVFGIIWASKNTFNGLLHLRTTIAYLARRIHEGFTKLRQKDFKAIIRAKSETIKQSLTEFVSEENKTTNENTESEEDLLRELNENKKGNNAFENAVERFTKYL